MITLEAIAARFRMTQQLPTRVELEGLHLITVDELAKVLYPDLAYDTTLPQGWVNNCVARKRWDPCGQVVWGYPDVMAFNGMPVPLTEEAKRALGG